MSTDKTLPSRIPFEDIQSVSAWQLPNLGGRGKVVPSVKRDDKKKASDRQRNEFIEDLPDAHVGPMTADQLKTLTESAEKEAREAGYKQGYEKGMKQGEKKGCELGEQKAYRETGQKLKDQLKTFEGLADALFEPATDHQASLENTVLSMAVELAKHFIHSELSLNPSLMFPSVEQAVASLPAGAKHIRINVNPEDLAHIEETFSAKRGLWQFVADPRLTRGGCEVSSDVSRVDFSFEKRIDEWQRAIQTSGEPDAPIPEVIDYRPKSESIVEDQAEPEIPSISQAGAEGQRLDSGPYEGGTQVEDEQRFSQSDTDSIPNSDDQTANPTEDDAPPLADEPKPHEP